MNETKGSNKQPKTLTEEEKLDERLSKIDHNFRIGGKKAKWSDIKKMSLVELRMRPDVEGNIPSIWQKNMKAEGLSRR